MRQLQIVEKSSFPVSISNNKENALYSPQIFMTSNELESLEAKLHNQDKNI